MDFQEAEHIGMLRESLRRFLEQKFSRQQAREWDRKVGYPREVFEQLCELGVCGLTIPEEYGGAGVDIVAAIAVIEELTRRGTFLSGPYIHAACYGGLNVAENGNEAQKRELLPKLAAGKILFAYGLSEPDVGGDLASIQTTATLDADGTSLLINGTKRWCTGAHDADYILTLVRSGPKEDKYRNLSLVLVPTSSACISITDIEHTGFHYAQTTDVLFEDVRVSIEDVLGGSQCLNQGWSMLAGAALNVERIETAALAYGIAVAAVEDAWQYAQERRQFGKPICAHQAVRHDLSEIKTRLEACRLMMYHAAWMANEGRDCAVESSMAKLFVADTAVEIVLTCQRIMGAYGYASDYDMERYVRDVIVIPIAGGSSNMQKNNIANRLGLPAK
jgi:alkylation response protein AidB-like acyl-CoA dehydrogenase